MIINPVLPIWLLILMAAALAAFGIWQWTSSPRGKGLKRTWALRVVMTLLLLIVAIRPTIPGEGQGPTVSGGLEVYFVVDTTSSMAAEDYGSTYVNDEESPATRLASTGSRQTSRRSPRNSRAPSSHS